jgi:hypothetical protein
MAGDTVYSSGRKSQDVPPCKPSFGHLPRRMTPRIDPVEARRNWVGWVLWYMETHPEEVPSRTELARRLDVSKGAITQLLDVNSNRAPSFATLVHSSNLTGFPVDAMLRSIPPSRDSRRRK